MNSTSPQTGFESLSVGCRYSQISISFLLLFSKKKILFSLCMLLAFFPPFSGRIKVIFLNMNLGIITRHAQLRSFFLLSIRRVFVFRDPWFPSALSLLRSYLARYPR